MLPARYSALFRSRRSAFLWAAGICWTALQFVDSVSPRPDTAAQTGNMAGGDVMTNDAADLQNLESLVARLQK